MFIYFKSSEIKINVLKASNEEFKIKRDILGAELASASQEEKKLSTLTKL